MTLPRLSRFFGSSVRLSNRIKSISAGVREIGSRARLQMERLFDRKVFLQTWVRVREGWSDDEAALRSLGYHD